MSIIFPEAPKDSFLSSCFNVFVPSLADVSICNNVYATVKESEILTSHKICGGSARVTHAYTSVTDTVELRMFSQGRHDDDDPSAQTQNQDYYVIKYNGESENIVTLSVI